MTKRIVSWSRDAKTVKGEKKGVLTGICYLLPEKSLGRLPTAALVRAGAMLGWSEERTLDVVAGATTVCAWAGSCAKPCLVSAGNGRFDSTQLGRARRTLLYHGDRARFWREVARDIARLIEVAAARGLKVALRLDGTSDVLTREAVRLGLVAGWIAQGVAVYAYTKAPLTAMRPAIDAGVYVTFSLQAGARSATHAAEYVEAGLPVAVVFGTPASAALPRTWQGLHVVDGRAHDVRSLDRRLSGGLVRTGQPYVVGLSALGAARKDASGFVVRL